MNEKDAQLRIRLPRDVKEWLEKEAKANLRTQGAEIVIALRARMEEQRGQ